MLAHMPLFRNEHYEGMELLYRWLTRPLPRQEQMQVVGKKIVPVQQLLVMGDRLPHPQRAVEDDVPAALSHGSRLMARMGFLRRNENWSKIAANALSTTADATECGIRTRDSRVPRSSDPWVWSSYPLEPSRAGDERCWPT